MTEESIKRKYVKLYMQTVEAWTGKLPEVALHQMAARVADKAHRLMPEEKREVDAWLDGKYPVRTRPREDDKPAGLFDDVLRAG